MASGPRPSETSPLTVALAMVFGLAPAHGFAQAVERNLPRSEPRPDAPIIAPAPKLADGATPIGPGLSALIIVGGSDKVEPMSGALQGVDLHRVGRLKGTGPRFAKFLGRPISQKLIADIGAEILAVHRAQGHPLINISTPPQDISDGVLRIRVLEFTVGNVELLGAPPDKSRDITGRVRLTPGGTVDTKVLAEDLEWLNRDAFRQVSVTFSPSPDPGSADVALQAKSTRPWRVSAGYANSGSPQTGLDRYFVGVQARVPGLRDAVASYQGTASNDALFDNGRLFQPALDPRYRSHGLSVLVPTRPRQSFEVTLNDIQTNQAFAAFVANSSIREATATYRASMSSLGLAIPGEVALGLEARQSLSRIKFGGVTINKARFDVYQLLAGYGWRGNGRIGTAQVSTTFHMSPGDINDYNTDRAFAAYSTRRFDSADYRYVAADLTYLSAPFSALSVDGMQVFSNLSAQYAGKALPTTEQIGLGGSSAVRGYTLDDGAFDSGVIMRTDLSPGPSSLGGRGGSLAPRLFVDLGYGKANATGDNKAVAAVGVGVNYTLNQRVTLSLDLAVPLRDLGNTESGHPRLGSLLAVSF